MVPETLAEWTIPAIEAIAAAGIGENDRFDFKLVFQKTEALRKAVVAFANTRGGFLVYGVANSGEIVGVGLAEFPREFGNRIRAGIEPSIDYRIGSPLEVENGRSVYVVEVPRSQRVPHAVLLDGTWTFLKRSAGGTTERMSYEEIRLAFQDTETRRSKLALVASELDLISFMATRLRRDIPEESSSYTMFEWAWLTRYPTNLLDGVLGDAYSLIARERSLWGSLCEIRDSVRTSNIYCEALSALKFSAIDSRGVELSKLQNAIRTIALKLENEITQAKRAITSILSLEV